MGLLSGPQIHALAGQPASPELLVNVPRLITAYYTERPDPSIAGETVVRQVMARGQKLDGPAGGYEYTASVPASRPAGDYTPRLVPHHPEAAVPLETKEILWAGSRRSER